MKVGLRDAAFYERPSGFGANPRPPKYHAIVNRPGNKYGVERGPACGIPLHVGEYDAATIPARQRCGKPACKAAFEAFDRQEVANAK
ncbi:hypothetical protein [Stenotrophomonas maltophilia]|uniref:hypothetical protein n=1 Tax=Stenotrophomonas maltophilia TaxID=40324 RepID=UPI000C16056B|nr:hypothetical protein [Stenotrophomonas maltophilia]RRU72205.1 hypothetical protein EGJ89_10380 [Stenotrophomonas maltophilia]